MNFPTRLLPTLLFMAVAAHAAEKPLFNNRNLEGWSGDPRLWTVENGFLVGRTDHEDRSISANSFLIYEGKVPADFELSYRARISGNNSGVQYRSEIINREKWQLAGYQMDLHPKQEFLGMLYEERGRGIVCRRGQKVVLKAGKKPRSTGKLERPQVDLGEWNSYRIVVRGNVLQHYVDGELAVEVVDEDLEKRRMDGVIGLQLHKGPPMKVEYDSILLRELELEKPKVEPEGASVGWIWGASGTADAQKVFFRKEFVMPDDVAQATLEVVCDNGQRTWVNGQDLGMEMDWSRSVRKDVGAILKPGRNVIAVEGRNDSGPAGLAFRLSVELTNGSRAELVSDRSWSVSPEAAEGWLGVDFDAGGWGQARLVGMMGDAPWGDIFGKKREEVAKGPGLDVTDEFKVLPGFKLEKIRDVSAGEGSWVAMTVGPDGHLICGDQYGGIYQVDVGTGVSKRLPIELDGVHALLWFQDSLYVTVNESQEVTKGVYRVRANGDEAFGKPELLKKLEGRGEHGPHALVASPDGKWIYFCAGNATKVPEMDASMVPEVWQEDQLLPRRPDPRGHATRFMAPGGWIARFRPDGSNWQLQGIGLRNAFDIAFNAEGDLFTYDADMEWDLGMPWYRPTRINHVIPGAEFGWRNGTGKWPSYSEDSMPAVVNIGPGSPAGLVSGRGAAFPAKYQRAIYALDWTFATIHVIHLRKDGETYTATTEELVAGEGLPLTDAGIGKDGSLYFLTGGRRTGSALWRVSYVGDEASSPAQYADRLPQGLDRKSAVAGLSSSDRTLRQKARLYFERRPGEIPDKLGKVRGKTWETIQAAIIQARLHEGSRAKEMLRFLTALDFASLELQQQLAWLRAAGLAAIRGDGFTEGERASVIEAIDSHYPASNDDLNAELVRLLVYVNAPGVVGRTLNLMDTAPPAVAPDWLAIAERNSRYGATIKSMLEAQPPGRVIHFVYALRCVPGPWDRSERERFFNWLKRLDSKSGGKSYSGFLKDLTEETLTRATDEEREWLMDFVPEGRVDPFANLPKARGPGRAWTVEEVKGVAAAGFDGADLAHGEKMFRASLCAACHSYGGQGGAAGPDLSSLGGRFTVESLALALIEPSREVSDQYAFDVLEKKDGNQVVGRIVEEKDDRWLVAVNPFDFSQTIEVERSDVASIEPSPVSPMPGGLINQLNEEELRDLLAFLLGKS